MKIVIVSRGIPTSQYPLNGIFEFDQAKALHALGHEVVVLAVDLHSVRHRRKYGITEGIIDGIRWYKIDVPVGAIVLRVKCFIGSIALKILYNHAIVNEEYFDIMHAHFTDIGSMAVKLSEEKKIPLVITEHSSWMNKEVIHRELKKCAAFSYSSAACLIAVSEALKEKIEKNINISAIVVPNIVSDETFILNPKTHYGFGYIVTANLVEGKRHSHLIDAFFQVQKEYEDVYLGIVGDGVLKSKLEKYVKELGICEKVRFYGVLHRKEINELYQTYDCFVLPSQSETFGVAYVEAMMAGLPVIATRCGGPEGFVTEENGVLVPVDDRKALVDAMIKLYMDKDKYDSKKISQHTKYMFGAECIGKQIEKVYSDILGGM